MFFFFFFKQKTAYDIMPSLVGSEMCIGDGPAACEKFAWEAAPDEAVKVRLWFGKSMTHTGVPARGLSLIHI